MKKILLTLFFSLLFLPQLTFADGAYFPPDGYYMYETGQKAAIFYDNGTQTMALSTSFEGDANKFTWIVPTPSKPEVTKLSKDLFVNLEKLTQVEYYNNNGVVPMDYGVAEVATKDVTVVEQKYLGYYDITILEATNAEALYKYLSDNGFSYPEEGKYILDEYISLGWNFTAIKISENALKDAGLTSKLNRGDISPLKFVFATDKIVYPMKISGITRFDYEDSMNALDLDVQSTELAPYQGFGVNVDLYVFTDHKQEISGYNVVYANWIKPAQIEKLANDDAGNSWVNASKKYYLTKFSDYKSYNQMEDDLFPVDADNDAKVGVTPWYLSFWDFIKNYFVLLLIVFTLCFYISLALQIKTDDKKIQKRLWILQLISIVLLNIPLVLLMIAFFVSNSWHYWGTFYDFQIWLGVILLLMFPLTNMILLLILQKRLQK